jgi:hypothetical protein
MLRYDGSTWTQYGAFAQFGKVGLSTSKFWGTGNDLWLFRQNSFSQAPPALWHWNGAGWAAIASIDIASGVFGLVGTTPWVIGNLATCEWDGSQWIERPALQGTPLAIGDGGGTVMAVLNNGAVARLMGNAWAVTPAGWSTAAYDAVIVDSTLIVVGRDDSVAFWDNGTWTTRATPIAGRWDKITATSSSDVWVAGASGNRARSRLHWDGMT